MRRTQGSRHAADVRRNGSREPQNGSTGAGCSGSPKTLADAGLSLSTCTLPLLLLYRTLLLSPCWRLSAGVVTAFLMYNVTCYGRRRLWRGPHWVDALNQVRLAVDACKCDELRQQLCRATSAVLHHIAGVDNSSHRVPLCLSPVCMCAQFRCCSCDILLCTLDASSNPHLFCRLCTAAPAPQSCAFLFQTTGAGDQEGGAGSGAAGAAG